MIDRRLFISSSSMFALAGCVTCKLPEDRSVEIPISDSHAHFFNLSDLPVRNFLQYVIIPEHAPNVPEVALAIADIAAWIAKRLSISAKTEMRRLELGELFGEKEITAEEFGEEAASRHQSIINERGFFTKSSREPLSNLADSHYYLALLLGTINVNGNFETESQPFVGGITIDPEVFTDIALNSANAKSKNLVHASSISREYSNWLTRPEVEVKVIIAWVFLMAQSRCYHVNKYQATVDTIKGDVVHASNLLVDYDRWLGETPANNSTHEQQVEYWTKYADKTKAIKGAIKLHTFAGFDPLKDAGERLSGIENTTFQKMKKWAFDGRQANSTASHRIVGFKIYPPMGFQPNTNERFVLPNCKAGESCRAEREVREWWTGDGQGWNESDIGAEIDISLDEFYNHCAENDIPIMTHCNISNGSMRWAKYKADPSYWLPLAEKRYRLGLKPLRVCMGHFGASLRERSVLTAALKTNKPQGDGLPASQFYFDISYNEDIIGQRPLDLLDALASTCKQANDLGDYIMFGSDWIMIEQNSFASSYLQSVKDAAADHEFWGDKLEKLFYRNFLNFINLPN